MGKWVAAPEQNQVTIDINLMANNSSPSTGVSGKTHNGINNGVKSFITYIMGKWGVAL